MQSKTTPTGRVCSKCQRDLPADQFYKDARYPDGLRRWCRACCGANVIARYYRLSVRERREMDLRKTHGITHDEYDALLGAQGGACGICGLTFEEYLHVDHDHETGAVRGLLCRRCNTGMGQLGDTVEGLQRALDYLLKAS